MERQGINILRSPGGAEPLKFREGDGDGNERPHLVSKGGRTFQIYRGIPVLMDDDDAALIKRGNGFYDMIAPLYDFLHAAQAAKKGGESAIRREFLDELEINRGDRVLEVSVGTGANLGLLPNFAEYYGLDPSMQMLRRCQKRMVRQGLHANLIMGTAEKLPFAANAFDKIFSVCAFRLFGNQDQALQEMVRVAKPGGRIMIVDQKKTEAPVNRLPSRTLGATIKEFPAWDLYGLTFEKSRF